MDDSERCTATARSTGERCKQPAIPGGNVCRFHGGSAKQVQEKAQERLDRMADEITADVHQIVSDLVEEYEEADLEDKLAIQQAVKNHWLPILDRTGHGPTETREVTGDGGGAVEIALNETIVETEYEEDE